MKQLLLSVLLFSSTVLINGVQYDDIVIRNSTTNDIICSGLDCSGLINGGFRHECRHNGCNFCGSGNCCDSQTCNDCSNDCCQNCGTTGCWNQCVNTCYRKQITCCESCERPSCRSRCHECPRPLPRPITTTTTTPRSPDTTTPCTAKSKECCEKGGCSLNSTMDVDIGITNTINNTNIIHNPIYVNSTNVNNIVLHGHQDQGTNISINTSANNTQTSNSSCCMVVPPRECNYNATYNLQCNQTSIKQCSPICRSPLVYVYPVYIPVHHPGRVRYIEVPKYIPIYINNSRPVVINKPYPVPYPVIVSKLFKVPVYIEKRVIVPYPYPKPFPIYLRIPITQYVREPVYMPYPVDRYITKTVPEPFPVKVPVVIPQPYYIYQRIPVNNCPLIIYRGAPIRSCANYIDAMQFRGTTTSFIINPYPGIGVGSRHCFPINHHPWYSCGNYNIERCGGCAYCGGEFSRRCMYSKYCPASCLPHFFNHGFDNIKQFLKCTTKGNSVSCL